MHLPPPEVVIGKNAHSFQKCYAVLSDCRCVTITARLNREYSALDSTIVMDFDQNSAIVDLRIAAKTEYPIITFDIDLVDTGQIVLPEGAYPYLRKVYREQYAKRGRKTISNFLNTDAVDIYCHHQPRASFTDSTFTTSLTIKRLGRSTLGESRMAETKISAVTAIMAVLLTFTAIGLYVSKRNRTTHYHQKSKSQKKKNG